MKDGRAHEIEVRRDPLGHGDAALQVASFTGYRLFVGKDSFTAFTGQIDFAGMVVAMEPLPLDPGTYQGTYKLVGGELSLDFVNTVSWPGTGREHDWFDRPENVTLWAAEVHLIDDVVRHDFEESMSREVARWARELQALRDIRGALRDAISPLAHEGFPDRQSIDRVNRLLDRAGRRRSIDPTSLEWSWPAPANLTEMIDPVVWNAGDVLTRIDRSRLRYCPSCDWLFHDTTRNRSRRWCDMRDCGSRDKALRYYHRRKPSAATSQSSPNE